MKIIRIIVFAIVLCLIPLVAQATDVYGVSKSGGLFWDIAPSITSDGDTYNMVANLKYTNCSLWINVTALGSTLSAATKIGYDKTYWSTTNTYTISATGLYSYSISAPTPFLKVTYDIGTTGTIADTVVFCSQ